MKINIRTVVILVTDKFLNNADVKVEALAEKFEWTMYKKYEIFITR